MFRRFPTLFWLIALAASCFALPGIDRVRIISPHFEFSVASTDQERVRNELAPMAETIWDSLAKITGFTPPVPVTLIVRDEDDYSNGYAIPFMDWVSVWEAPLDFDFRGGTLWRANVMSHELSHIFTMRALGYTSHWLGHSVSVNTARTHSAVSVSAEFSTDDLESWLAEGLAQYGAERCGFDTWDSHRDMLERIAWLSGAILPDPMLVTFTGDSRESEVVYNDGYSFIRFVMNHGKSTLAEFLRYGGSSNIRQAIQVSFGKPFADVFEMWRQDLRTRHGNPKPEQFSEAASWLKIPVRLDYLKTASPVRVSKERYILSSHKNDNGSTELYKIEEDGSPDFISSAVEGRLAYNAQGNSLVYIHMDVQPNHREIRELYTLDTKSGATAPLTKNARAVDASFGPDGLYYIGRSNGANRLFRYEGLEKSTEIIASPAGYDFVSVAAASRPGFYFLGVMGIGGYRLMWYDATTGLQRVLLGGTQVRDPYVANDFLYFSMEKNGVWQIARVPETHLEAPVQILTSEIGGAFQPSVADSTLSFVSYSPHGFLPREVALEKISLQLDLGKPLATLAPARDFSRPSLNPLIGAGSGNSINMLGIQTFTNFNSQRPTPPDSGSLGDKFIFGAAIEFTDPSQENTVIASYQGMVGAGGTWGKQPLDNSFTLGWQSESFTPYISAQASVSQQTPEWGNHPPRYSFTSGSTKYSGNYFPQYTQTLLQLLLQQPLNNTWRLNAMAAKESESEYDTTFRQKNSLVDDWAIMGGISGSKLESGRYGILSGVSFTTNAGLLESTARHLVTDTVHTVWRGVVAEPSLNLYANLYRSILLSTGLYADVLAYNDSTITQFNVYASIGIPLPRMNASFHIGDRSFSFFDPMLHLSYRGENLNRDTATVYSPTNNMLSNLRETGSWRPQAAISQSMPWNQARVRIASISAELDWQIITFGHTASTWYVQANVPLLDAKHPESPNWAIGLSF